MLHIEKYKIKDPGRKGLALLIVSIECQQFDVNHVIEKDALVLKVFWSLLGYEVIFKENLTEKEFVPTLKEFSKLCEQSSADSCVIHVLSPAEKEALHRDTRFHSVDGGFFSHQQIICSLNSGEYEWLKNRPKIFFFTLYTSEKKQWIEPTEMLPATSKSANYSDVFIVSTLQPCTVAESAVVHSLIKSFRSRPCDDFLSIIEHLCRDLRCGKWSECEIRWECCGVTKLLYLEPVQSIDDLLTS